ncbi:hypothetical protein [Mycoplasma putrefaciens]|uniref:Uncharacterized protein n=1 Tax=Mycoplasma putrefaciens Mput9231 TaxID=1292033 RepID=M9WBY0_9MOLU|nr:hypothetical protein [Mycoplasma putrefaciens]AGJ90672.1 Hypothetical protein, predicted transmembrane protein [Mycoplasma putrefaciens Mput9231]
MNKKFISRNEIFADEIALINKETKQAGHDGKYTDYIQRTLNQLKVIDPQYFSTAISTTNKEFEDSRFYLGKSKLEQNINFEIIENIQAQLSFLKDINLNQTTNNNSKLQTNFLDDEKYYSANLKQLSLNIYSQLEASTKKYNNSEIIKTNFDSISNSKNSKLDKDSKLILDKVSNTKTSELVKECKTLNLEKLNELDRKRQMYQINTKWFSILFPICILVMIVSIVIPVFY